MLIGYLLAILIGLVMGLLGGGGAILTIPALVYVLDFTPKEAVTMSLGIVSLTSLIGTYSHHRKNHVLYSKGLFFLSSAALGSITGAQLSQFIDGFTQMTIFSTVMFMVAILMLKPRAVMEQAHEVSKFIFLIQAFFVGNLIGLIGVGGGFLIVPTLVLMSKMEMRNAIGTSLFIISANSIVGFFAHLLHTQVDYVFLFVYAVCMSVGVIIGTLFTEKISQDKLRRIFAILLFMMSFFVFYQNQKSIKPSETLSSSSQ